MLGNLSDFNPEQDMVDIDQLMSLDKYALTKLNWVIERVVTAYREFDFHVVFHTLYNYCSVDLSSLYLDILKDRLYCEKKDGQKRRSAQTVLHLILNSLVKLMAPILSFTSEEVWKEFKHSQSEVPSVHMTDFPRPVVSASLVEFDTALWDSMVSLRQDVSKALEEARASKLIGSSLEAKVQINANHRIVESVRQLDDPEGFFIISQLGVTKADDDAPTEINVIKAEGAKCPRCWIWSTEIGKDGSNPEVCPRCASVLEQSGLNV